VRTDWQSDDVQPFGVYDGKGGEGGTGFGEDARALIDRAPLAERIALSRDARLPAALRLDLALTSFARAIALWDDASADGLAADLEKLLPQMAQDWRRARTATPGTVKRFDQYLILAKIPGLRPDLVDYTRPEGAVADFQDHWIDWVLLPKARPAKAAPRPLAYYQQGGTGALISWTDGAGTTPDALTDLTCLGECGCGAAPLRTPDFLQAGQGRAAAERGYFVYRQGQEYSDNPVPSPAGGGSVWEEMLAYAQVHPKDPQVPEALYWLVHVGHFGGSHNHSGQRAFKLLHARYPTSEWAKKTPYYFD